MSADAPIQCSKCSRPASDSETRCSHCGGPLVRSCLKCGSTSSAAKRFCDKCGTRLRPDTVITARRRSARPHLSDPYRGTTRPGRPGAAMGPGHDPFRGPAPEPAAAPATETPAIRDRRDAAPAWLWALVACLCLACLAVLYAIFSGKLGP